MESSTSICVNDMKDNIAEALILSGWSEGDATRFSGMMPADLSRFFSGQSEGEARDFIDTLCYIAIAENVEIDSGRGFGALDKDCYAHTQAPLFELENSGLIESEELSDKRIYRVCGSGRVLASAIISKRIASINFDELASITAPIVPMLFSTCTDGGYLSKVCPAMPPADESTYLSFLLKDNPGLFSKFAGFSEFLKMKGCAVIARLFAAKSEAELSECYVYPDEFAMILKELLERTDGETVESMGMILEDIRQDYDALMYIGSGVYSRDQIGNYDFFTRVNRVLRQVGPTVHILGSGSGRLPSFLILDQAGFDEQVRSIKHELKCRWADAQPGLVSIMPEERVDRVAPLPPTFTADTITDECRATPEEEMPEVTVPDLPEYTIMDTPTKMPEEEILPVPASPSPQIVTDLDPDWEDSIAAAEPDRGPLDVMLGKNYDGDPVYWSPGSLSNGHVIIIGGSGAGKTETIRCISSELEKLDYPVVMIDFHGDMACDGCDLRSFRIREGSPYYFNPFELDPEFAEITPLRATSDFVDAISINFPTLGIQQRRRIKGIVKECYNLWGISSDPATWRNRSYFDDVEQLIMDCEDEAIPAYLEDIFDYKLFSGESKISIREILSDGITHINLNALPENLRYLFADLFLRRLYYSLQAMGETPRGTENDFEKFRLFVIVDEAKLLVSQKTNSKQTVKAVLNKYATEMRKFGVGLVLASQLIGHFNEEILANISVKFCMKAENKKQAQENAKFFEVSESDLLNFRPGEGVLIVGNDKMNVRITPSYERK